MTTAYNNMVEIVASEFETVCNDEGFGTFSEMVRCYQMNSADIKREICDVICATKSAYMDEDTGEITLDDNSDEPYQYKPFVTAVRKELKRRDY